MASTLLKNISPLLITFSLFIVLPEAWPMLNCNHREAGWHQEEGEGYDRSNEKDNLEIALAKDIEDGTLDDFTHIEAAFVLSGVSKLDSLKAYINWYSELIQGIKGFHLNPFDRVGSASKVFSYLHSTWLLHYKEEATTLLDVVRTKRYNCVAGTILFNLICSDLGWQTEAFETPTHVYTIFSNFTENVTVENTSPMGFNIMRNLKEYSQYLLQFYPQNKALQIGYDRIYAHENSKGRKITNTELLGLLAYNRAYFAKKAGDFETAYEYVLLAQKFNRDSRSNVSFEIDLYFKWGGALFRSHRFTEAFTVYADGYYRYSNVKELAQNCCIAFQNALADNWSNQDWQKTKTLFSEVEDLNLMDNCVDDRVKSIVSAWETFFIQRRMNQELEECRSIKKKVIGKSN